jgi:formylglycine-generating enzyme required for sulfatase activity
MSGVPQQPGTNDLVFSQTSEADRGALVLGRTARLKAQLFAGTRSQQMAAIVAALSAGSTEHTLVLEALRQGKLHWVGSLTTAASPIQQLQQVLSRRFLEFADRTTQVAVPMLDRQGHLQSHRCLQVHSFRVPLAPDTCLEMVAIPGGTFLMGAPESGEVGFYPQTQRRVQITSFFISKYPVTQGQWQAVASLAPSQRLLTPQPACFQGRDRPVESITWYEAWEFCERLSRQSGLCYRLPTEAEWEYACRASSVTPFHYGETLSPEFANYNGNYLYRDRGFRGRFRGETTPVGRFGANAFGLYDLHGNVWEWCNEHDWFNPDNDLPRSLRGGSWASHPIECHASFHCGFEIHRCSSDVGFRVVCSLPWATAPAPESISLR